MLSQLNVFFAQGLFGLHQKAVVNPATTCFSEQLLQTIFPCRDGYGLLHSLQTSIHAPLVSRLHHQNPHWSTILTFMVFGAGRGFP
jgi:hypothetical protein